MAQVGLGRTTHMSRYLAVFFAAGGTVAHLSLFAPQSPEVDVVAVRLTATAAYPAAALLFFAGPRLPKWAMHVLLFTGTAIITLGMHFSGGGVASATTPIFFIWVALFAFMFFSSVEGCVHLVLIAALYSVEVVASGARESIGQWVTVVGTVIVTGYVVGRLVDYNTELVVSDPLTGLTNRRALDALLAQELERSARVGTPIGIAVLDLDNFKHVNDTLGHGVGDDLLRVCAQRLSACVRTDDVVARLGGDEFAVVFTIATKAAPELGARRILEAFAEPIVVGGHDLSVSASIGIAYSTDGVTPVELLRNADLAMYVAKASGGGGFEVYEESMYERAVDRLQLEADLRDAVANSELTVEFQPIVAIGSGAVLGVEVLARWTHPERGAVPPEVFIPIAERTGLIGDLGQQVFQQACQAATLLHRIDPQLEITVNVSPVQLAAPDLADRFADVLAGHEVDPARVVVEITETALVQDVALAAQRLAELKRVGLRVAVDDFGVGHSSLSHLRNFPVDVLKIDKSFVDGLPDGGQLARAVIQMGAMLGLDVVAEGIEQQAQLDELRVLGCAQGQGYLFASPMSYDALSSRLRSTVGDADAAVFDAV